MAKPRSSSRIHSGLGTYLCHDVQRHQGIMTGDGLGLPRTYVCHYPCVRSFARRESPRGSWESMKHRNPPDVKGAMHSAKARARVRADDRVRHPLKSFPAFALCCRDLAIGVLIRRDASGDAQFEVNRRAIAALDTVWSHINISSECHKEIA
jgi:hypothetical protein